MSEICTIQTKEIRQRRLLEEIRSRKVNSVKYFGLEGTEEASKKFVSARQAGTQSAPVVFTQPDGEVTVVDLGPGSGIPCVEALQKFRARIRNIICIDVSPDILNIGINHIRQATDIPVEGIVADFLEDTNEIAQKMNQYGQKLFLCLGCTAGNYDQHHALCRLQALLGYNDHLLLGLGLVPKEEQESTLQQTAKHHASRENCIPRLMWLSECGVAPQYEHVFPTIEDEMLGTKVIRIFYRFPEGTTLLVAGETVSCPRDETIRFIETRRFAREQIEKHLFRCGALTVVAREEIGDYGFYLCQRGASVDKSTCRQAD